MALRVAHAVQGQAAQQASFVDTGGTKARGYRTRKEKLKANAKLMLKGLTPRSSGVNQRWMFSTISTESFIYLFLGNCVYILKVLCLSVGHSVVRL